MCLDADSGKVHWSKPAVKKNPSIPRHIKNSYASETPVTDGKLVFASFGAEGLYCFDVNGKLKWNRSLGDFKLRYGWGTAISPVLYENLVIQVCDRENGSVVLAFDKQTGTRVWETPRDEKSSWSTPLLFDAGDHTELITNASGRMRAYNPADGNLLWECAGASSIVSPTPVSTDGLVIVSSGYVGDKNRPIYAFRPGATGDISLPEGKHHSDTVAWHLNVGGPYIPSPVIVGPNLYVLLDRGFLTCFNAATGESVYGKNRLGRRSQFTASPVAGDGKIYCLSEDGTCYVVQAGSAFKLIAANELDEICMASPAVADGRLFIRARKNLYCIGP
jgi:outer membrane protein assembly factor BamB